MEIKEIKKSKSKKYNLEMGKVNIILDSEGTLFLPVRARSQGLVIAFPEAGTYTVKSQEKSLISVGHIRCEAFTTHPGKAGYDVQPHFGFIKSLNLWMYLGIGNWDYDEATAVAEIPPETAQISTISENMSEDSH